MAETVNRDELFEKAESLLPKYGDVAMFALLQATLLADDPDRPWSMELTEEFQAWLDERRER